MAYTTSRCGIILTGGEDALLGSSGGISKKIGPMIPLSLSSDRIFSGVLCYEGEIDDGLLLLTHLLLSGEA